MISGLTNTRIFLYTADCDMRRSFDSLCGIIRRAMNLDPLSGYLFVFKNRRGDRIKTVYWDNDGYAMWYKALQRGTFRFPNLKNFTSAGLEIDASTLRMILDGIDLGGIRRRHRYKYQPPDMTISLIPELISGTRTPADDSFPDRNP